MISAEAFHRHLLSLAPDVSEAPLLVALSGGCDSVVLLHLLRFSALADRITAAHLDHALRPESGADATWVRGLCASWSIPLVEKRLPSAPANEEEARDCRYAFLRSAAAEIGARYTFTAHHADDQAETVLFRILRGTGISGLAGIPPISEEGLIRPLLPYWREDIEQYAWQAGLDWRVDATNADLAFSRNWIRHDLLPHLEREMFPNARRGLVALTEIARENEDGWSRIVEREWPVAVRSAGEGFLLARDKFQDYDPALSTRLLRRVLRELGIVLSRAGTRRTLQFITDAPSGRHLQLPNGLRVLLEFEEARVERRGELAEDEPLKIVGSSGRGTARLGGRVYTAFWSTEPGETTAGEARWSMVVDLRSGPFELRARKPGDRVRTRGGTKTLKKVYLEQRVPVSERSSLPVLVDEAGAVVWAAGVRPTASVPLETRDRLQVWVTDD